MAFTTVTRDWQVIAVGTHGRAISFVGIQGVNRECGVAHIEIKAQWVGGEAAQAVHVPHDDRAIAGVRVDAKVSVVKARIIPDAYPIYEEDRRPCTDDDLGYNEGEYPTPKTDDCFDFVVTGYRDSVDIDFVIEYAD